MKQKGRYVIILIVVILLWNTIVIKPLKIFTVFLHELGHSLMAVIFGNGIKGFRINLDESGYAITMPKNELSAFIIANGGYLGSVFFALLILKLKNTFVKKYILGASAILLLGVSIAYGKSVFTIIYAAIFAGFILLLYMLKNEKLNDWVIDILGVSSAAYAIYDTFVDTILLQINHKLGLIAGWGGQQPVTDAVIIERMTHVPAVVWGMLWLIIACVAVYTTISGKKRQAASSRGKRKTM
ncbi:MAG: M50 family metallopeptidase [Clostridiaceae bacterium]|nr:M50 family metallopeptidase [Clostridiaceae bacterium]